MKKGQEATASRAPEKVRPHRRGRSVAIITAGAVLVAAVVTGGIAYASELDRQAVVEQAQRSQQALVDAQEHHLAAQHTLIGDLQSAVTLHTNLTAVLEDARTDTVTARLGSEPAKVMTEALKSLMSAVESMATHNQDSGTVTLVTKSHPVDPPMIPAEAEAATARVAADEYSAQLEGEHAALAAILRKQETLDTEIRSLVSAIVGVQLHLPDTIEALLATNSSANSDAQEAFSEAATAFASSPAGGEELPEHLATFFDTAEALEAAQKAATRPVTGNNGGSDSGNYAPRSGSSGGNAGGNGGSGSAPPSGSSTPPPPPPPPPVDHTPRFSHNGNYKPGCGGMTFKYSQETSQGGTVVISVAYKYDVTTYPTTNGFGAKIYICTDQS